MTEWDSDYLEAGLREGEGMDCKKAEMCFGRCWKYSVAWLWWSHGHVQLSKLFKCALDECNLL